MAESVLTPTQQDNFWLSRLAPLHGGRFSPGAVVSLDREAGHHFVITAHNLYLQKKCFECYLYICFECYLHTAGLGRYCRFAHCRIKYVVRVDSLAAICNDKEHPQ
jgi:hypothetical protein